MSSEWLSAYSARSCDSPTSDSSAQKIGRIGRVFVAARDFEEKRRGDRVGGVLLLAEDRQFEVFDQGMRELVGEDEGADADHLFFDFFFSGVRFAFSAITSATIAKKP